MLPESNICKSSTKTGKGALSKNKTIIYKHTFLSSCHKKISLYYSFGLLAVFPTEEGQVLKRVLLVMLLINKAMLFKPLGTFVSQRYHWFSLPHREVYTRSKKPWKKHKFFIVALFSSCQGDFWLVPGSHLSHIWVHLSFSDCSSEETKH